MVTVHNISLIASDAKVRGGRPCIAGTSLRVIDVVMATLFHNQTPGDIAEAYDISLAQVYAALAYYYENKAELDADIREQVNTAKDFKEKRLGSAPPFLFG